MDKSQEKILLPKRHDRIRSLLRQVETLIDILKLKANGGDEIAREDLAYFRDILGQLSRR